MTHPPSSVWALAVRGQERVAALLRGDEYPSKRSVFMLLFSIPQCNKTCSQGWTICGEPAREYWGVRHSMPFLSRYSCILFLVNLPSSLVTTNTVCNNGYMCCHASNAVL